MVSKMENQNPRELEAGTYLEKHRVLDLLDNMTSMLIFGRPDDPKTFLIQQLEKLKIAKQSGMYYPCLFDDSNLTSIFGMLDPTKRGFITREQFVEALSTLGVKNFDEYPPGSEVNKITLDTFLRESKQGLTKSSSTFKQ
nr:EF-hand calcium-binding domain-containing protein 10-like [Ciona intestinalis]|eukprot:XP_002131050.1 EF-hand calcium-binding domain-containing protein 10-like [Ciona intestinalis]